MSPHKSATRPIQEISVSIYGYGGNLDMTKPLSVLLVDSLTTGHHGIYLRHIIDINNSENITFHTVLSESIPGVVADIKEFPTNINPLHFLLQKRKWLKHLNEYVVKINPDVVHFLTGDDVYQSAILGGVRLTNCYYPKILVTQHHVPNGRFRRRVFSSFCKKINKIIVHTGSAKKILCAMGIQEEKISLIHYPAFHGQFQDPILYNSHIPILKSHIPVLLSLGGTRYSKGLDVLLEALKSVSLPFRLVIAGKPEDFDQEFIDRNVATYAKAVDSRLRRVSDAEFIEAINAADCIVVPYRKSFDGASGPMTEGVWARKPIIGPNHGSLGDMIKTYKLGLTFEAENPNSLAEAITKFISEGGFPWNTEAEEFRKRLDPALFSQMYSNAYKELFLS